MATGYGDFLADRFLDIFQQRYLLGVAERERHTCTARTLEEKWITARQIEAARIAATRYMKREGQLWIRIFPDKPITQKPAEVRQGKGKGNVEYWAAVVLPGRIMFEVGGVPFDIAKEALRLAAQKLPIKTKFVVARDFVEA